MKRYGVFIVAVLTLLGMLVPPVFAQEMPKPKVTINGFFDLVTEWSDNKQDQNSTNEEDQWYYRERAFFLITGQVGKAKAVWRNELDFVNGATVSGQSGTSAGFDLDTDVAGVIETKWLYLEFPATGPGSLLPFIEQPTTARGGAQPFGHDDKVGILASGDYGGFSLRTAITPEVKNHFSYAQLDEGLCGLDCGKGSNVDNWAIVDTVEFTPQKGLTVRPTFSYLEMQGAGSAFLGNPNRGGFSQGSLNLSRGTIGADILWRQGPYSFDPTFHYQFGEQDTSATAQVDISAWIFDVIGGWREGPLNIQGRFVYTSGNDANECVTSSECSPGGEDINYYNPINPGFSYFGGWTEIWTGGIEYNNAFLGGTPGLGRRQSIGYDKYGLLTVAVRGTYSVTPAFSVVALVSPSWTAEDVDTNGAVSTGSAGTGITPSSAATGDENFLGTEINFGFNWKFAPNLTFAWRYAHLFAGDALDQCQPLGSSCTTPTEAEDIDLSVARVRFTF